MTVDIALEIASPFDAPAIAQLAADVKGRRQIAKGDIQQIRASITSPGQLWIVARAADVVIGYSATTPIEQVAVELETIHVDRRYRGGSIGTELLNETFRILSERGVSAVVVATATRAVKWLSRHGIQTLEPGQSVGLATAQGGFYALRPRPAERRPVAGVGFLPGPVPRALAWTIGQPGTPTHSDVAQTFYDAFVSRRAEVAAVLRDDKILLALAQMGRADLAFKWLTPSVQSIPI